MEEDVVGMEGVEAWLVGKDGRGRQGERGLQPGREDACRSSDRAAHQHVLVRALCPVELGAVFIGAGGLHRGVRHVVTLAGLHHADGLQGEEGAGDGPG